MNHFTEREQDVARLVIKGLTNKEIAGKLFLSHHTVKVHVTNLFYKTGLTNRTALAYMIGKNDGAKENVGDE